MSAPNPWWKSAAVFGAVAAALVTMAVDVVVGRQSGTPPDFLLFFGRFHPLVVHLPIGILVLVAAAEVATLSASLRQRVDPAIGLTLPVAVLSALAAFIVGHFLARGGGFPPQLLLWHRRLAVVVVLMASLCLVAWTYHAQDRGRASRAIYRVLLGMCLSVLSLGAHLGGTMTRGETYLSKYAPDILKPFLGGEGKSETAEVEKPKAGPEPLLFADVVLPLLRRQCVECHGSETTKGSLRLDSYEALMKGGDSGASIVAGSGEASLLIKRILLPISDDERMPPEGKPGPTPEEIELLRFWIDRGAKEDLRVRDALAPQNARTLLEAALEGSPAPPPRSSASADPGTAPSATPATSGSADPTSDPPPGGSAAPPTSPGVSLDDFMADPVKPTGPATPVSTPSTGSGLAWDERVKPILAARCESCHGANKQKGRLRVDTREAVLAGGAEGPAVVPGNPAASPLVARVRLPIEEKNHMPPKKEPQLTEQEIAILEAWIKKGAGADLRTAALPAPGPKVAAVPPRTPPKGHDPAPTSSAPPVASTAPPAASGAPPADPTSAPPVDAPPADAPPDPELIAKLPPRVALFQLAAQPILDDRCGACHTGTDATSGLRIDDHKKLLAGGISGPAVVPGDPEKSLLLQRIHLPISDGEHMPPEDAPQMTPAEIEVVRLWIQGGATTDLEVDTKALPPNVQQVLAAQFAKSAPTPKDGRPDAQPVDADVPDSIPPQAGGCASCTTSGGGQASLAALAWLGLGFAAFASRRRWRR